ncbi:FadR/GntR family transcriptional regulator [[Clostridium] fimetarium]|uniref:GntR family transcriptional regulator, transcriptional repressor for pyruvate dehydrogenase complex n=1 Tax=[Clostridium] fimetarium TaxID=99656 RepID=A0A1I0QLB2_9FIRM|nr:FCD domain-containing protein [[Clostridium] fimetarium]SEW27808.1 GntR family transcriptional regulator, transcriptional repressor for pyruvate dehydrogenase complex [[Clostridium] fimetarium]
MENREYSKVINYIKTMISESRLHQGDKLPTERELANTLSIGRYSIREALRIMDSMGMIDSRQGSGNYLVPNIGKNLAESVKMMLMVKQVNYLEISQLRRAIELYAYGCAINNLTPEKTNEMNQILEEMKIASGIKRAKLDKQFHDAIILGSNNNLIISIMESLSEVCQGSIDKVVHNSSMELKEKLMETHVEMLKYLIEKNIEKGKDAINKHYHIADLEYSKSPNDI